MAGQMSVDSEDIVAVIEDDLAAVAGDHGWPVTSPSAVARTGVP